MRPQSSVPRGGIHLTQDATVLLPAFEAAGWRVDRIEAASRRSFLDGARAALGFPAWFGRNLDALADALADLDRPTVLVWTGWQRLAVDAPDDWSRLLGVLRERALQQSESRPPFALVLA